MAQKMARHKSRSLRSDANKLGWKNIYSYHTGTEGKKVGKNPMEPFFGGNFAQMNKHNSQKQPKKESKPS